MTYQAGSVAELLTFLFSTGVVGVDSPASWATPSNGVYNLSRFDARVKRAGKPGSGSIWERQVDDTSSGHRQSFTGFGGSLSRPVSPFKLYCRFVAAVTDATVSVFLAFPELQKTTLLADLLTTSTDDGAVFGLFRHTIAASDLSAIVYAYSHEIDPHLANFDLKLEGKNMLSWLSQFKAMNSASKLWGQPGAFKDGGVDVNAITTQNNIGLVLKSAVLAAEIWSYFHNTDVPVHPQAVIDSAGSFVNTVAWHCCAQNNDWAVLTQFHDKNPNVAQYQIECWTSPTNTWYSTIDFVMG
ncbi:hypothetical protein V496_06502 [Pseudogymnoascus sp. VKM F-4515 (FW-2607)]|nr:hypothetical protein V496_06502 [Pseudogymnoascus sp. VKM F-4515 (FW-2607)]